MSKILDYLASSNGASGYEKFPSGLIIQWGSFKASTAGVAITYPIEFPNGRLSIALSHKQKAGGKVASMAADGGTKAGCSITSSVNSAYGTYIAIGY